MSEKIIFLDIDGVLAIMFKERDEFGSMFHPELVENLRTIINETGADIVISSTWRSAGLKQMQLMWEIRDLPGKVIDVTPRLWTERGEEIDQWLRENGMPKSYVIIDDDSDMMPDQLSNFVCTSKNNKHPDCIDDGYGLTKLCAEKAINILNRINHPTPQVK